MGDCQCQETQGQTRGSFQSFFLSGQRSFVLQSITIIPRRHRLRIYVDGSDKYYKLRELKRLLPDVVVKGVPSIERAIINLKEKDDANGKKGDKELLVEGYGLQKVMITEGACRS